MSTAVTHDTKGPLKLRLEAGGKICLILAQNDGTFVRFLRDKSVTKLDAWAINESHQCVGVKADSFPVSPAPLLCLASDGSARSRL
jgi:hypothetical protein